jgi:hypothetical protein
MSGIFKKIIIVIITLGAIIFTIVSVGNEPKVDNNLVSSNPNVNPTIGIEGGMSSTNSNNSLGTDEFLTKLLSIKNIELNGSIFEEPSFITLKDSSIILIQDGTEGRPNPFAPIGFDNSSTGFILINTPVSPVDEKTYMSNGIAN